MTKTKVKKDAIEAQIDNLSKQISYYVNEFTIDYLAAEMKKLLGKENKEGETSRFSIPDYQREFVWKHEGKRKHEHDRISRFIESIVMGLPIPFIFFYEDPKTGKLEIIDGTQRLRSIHEFIYEEYELSALKRLTELNGKRFSDLSDSRKRKFGNKTIRGIVLNENADTVARQDLFDRINTSSLYANPAEVRRGSLQGHFMTLIEKLARERYFVALIPTTTKKAKSHERDELVTRFFAYGDGLNEYNELPAKFLSDYVEKMNNEFAKNKNMAEVYENRFKQTMACVTRIFPLGFRKSENALTITRVRFESIAIGTWLAIRDLGDENKIKQKKISEWVNCVEYQKMLRADGGNVRKKLQARIEYVHKKLMGAE